MCAMMQKLRMWEASMLGGEAELYRWTGSGFRCATAVSLIWLAKASPSPVGWSTNTGETPVETIGGTPMPRDAVSNISGPDPEGVADE